MDDDLPYHRAARLGGGDHWWKPLVEGLLIVVLGVGLLVALVVVGLALAVVTGAGPDLGAELFDRVDASFEQSTTTDPLGLAAVLMTVVVLLPLTLLARLVVGPRPVGLLSSVTGRLRWSWMLRSAGLAAAVFVVLVPVSVVVGHLAGTLESVDTSGSAALVALLGVVLVMVPLQAAAEEYAFRGYLAQAIGRWLRHPAFAILLPVPLFVAGHEYDVVGQLGVAVFAVATGWITYRTGGLEAAIALHVVNNLAAFGLETVAGITDDSWVSLATGVLSVLVFCTLADRLARRHGVATRTHGLPRAAVLTR